MNLKIPNLIYILYILHYIQKFWVINFFLKQGCIKLIETEIKVIYKATKDFYFK